MTENAATTSARRRNRDRVFTLAINTAGTAVIALILLILAYLLVVAVPLAQPAAIGEAYELSFDAPAGSIAVDGAARLWRLADSDAGGHELAPLNDGRYAARVQGESVYLYDLQAQMAELDGLLADTAFIVPWLHSFRAPAIEPSSLALSAAGAQVLLAWTSPAALHALQLTVDRNGAVRIVSSWTADAPGARDAWVLADVASRRVLLVSGTHFLHWQLPSSTPGGEARVVGGTLSGVTGTVSAFAWGPGRESLLVATDQGLLHRFDPARGGLSQLGAPLSLGFPVRALVSEGTRRVSAALSAEGELLLFNPSSGETLLRTEESGMAGAGVFGIGADGDVLYLRRATAVSLWPVQNNFPETGWRSLWLPQSYAAYDSPGHVWQPEGQSIGMVSKFGMTPLLYGTFKAAIYGMLVAIPLSFGAAIYTGYFLSPRRRNQIKPAIEMLEAFPTVVLGFLAGLWLAPLLADKLFAVLVTPVLLLAVPLLLTLGQGALLRWYPFVQTRRPNLLLIFFAYLVAFALLFTHAESIEHYLLGGTARDWLWQAFGLRYDQRNALLVGLAMGLAITPVMFSIVEDAIFAVPRSLSDGSLALGATRWQSLARVVLPSASPALLSALLIGFGRGLGETMIVLLATGNTPIMESSLFSGLRSISATIATELPEAATASVHFRLLFLAALVLFALTFVLNTLAEIFRLRLRYAYAQD